MVQLRLHPRREQRMLLAACTSSRPAPAAYLGRRGDRDRPVGFADVAAMPEPEWATADRAGRYTVAGLVPAGQLVAVPLSTRVLDDVDTEQLLAYMRFTNGQQDTATDESTVA